MQTAIHEDGREPMYDLVNSTAKKKGSESLSARIRRARRHPTFLLIVYLPLKQDSKSIREQRRPRN
jgi:hypothetical protein